MKKALIIAYNFPPAGGGRVIRTIKFVKYLPKFGWKPIILTVKNPAIPERDPNLLNDVPKEAEIIRTPSWQVNVSLDQKICSAQNTYYSVCRQVDRNMLRLIRKIRSMIFIPDSRIGWIPFTLYFGLKLIRERNISLIYASGEPFSSFISAALLKRWTGLPLVLDFRDAWTEFNKLREDKIQFARQVEEYLEKFVMCRADYIISVTDRIIQDFKRRYPQFSDRFVLIPNGYDPEDLANLQVEKRERFVITYAGTLYKNRSPENLLKAVEGIITQRPELKDRIEIIFMGSIDSYVDQTIKRFPFKSVIKYQGFVSHKTCLKIMRNSDLLLLIEDKIGFSDRLLTGKLFEYLGLNKPILALAENGAIKELISRTHSGTVLHHDDVEGIEKIVLDYYEKTLIGEKRAYFFHSQSRDYEREELTKRLALLFDGLV